MRSTVHISARLAWHMDGWEGKICNDPKSNIYCIGTHTYPNNVIPHKRDLELEKTCSGRSLNDIKLKDYIPPCAYGINAFGKETVKACADTPEWYEVQGKQSWPMPPATISTWPYEEMYSDNVKNKDGNFNIEQRMANLLEMVGVLEANKSLVFYYANYSNPFTEDERKKYVLVGVSRIKKIHSLIPYQNATKEEQKKYAGAYVWQLPITSHYPDQGFRVPYHLYRNNVVADRVTSQMLNV